MTTTRTRHQSVFTTHNSFIRYFDFVRFLNKQYVAHYQSAPIDGEEKPLKIHLLNTPRKFRKFNVGKSVYTSLHIVKSFVRMKNKTSVFMIRWTTDTCHSLIWWQKKIAQDALVSCRFVVFALYTYISKLCGEGFSPKTWLLEPIERWRRCRS